MDVRERAPRVMVSLNGSWHLRPGKEREPGTGPEHEIPVPGLVDLAAPPYAWREHEYHWYRKSFVVPSYRRSALAFIRIGQAMFGTAVWCNGFPLGSDIACYTSQEYDISAVLKYDEPNEILIRVGARSTLPRESAVGNDQERNEWIPGIWGDVDVMLCGNPRISLVQVLPHLISGTAEVRLQLSNHSRQISAPQVSLRIQDGKGITVAVASTDSVNLTPGGEGSVIVHLPIPSPMLWSPDSPNLYHLHASVRQGETLTDRVETRFGMREFRVEGGKFMLNGKQIYLRGGNIAFHRFLSDPDRGTLPWDPGWIRQVLIDIPRAHNFNFFRNHLGQMYNRWYDIADEGGMLLQNEWMFWTRSGSDEQITAEFTRWLRDNWNHPSIIIWDALNESTDGAILNTIIPAMKALDPTRPWEPSDFVEQHPYIYSLGPVMNNGKFGFSESLEAIRDMPVPSMINEFLWWWLDKDFHPAPLMEGVVERWLGTSWTQEELIQHQSFLATELIELFRRMGVDAIQPFVYLSNNTGPTANWFTGDIRDLQPKPVLSALKNVFSPCGISLELWDRHFMTSEHRNIRCHIFNDNPVPGRGVIRYGVVNNEGTWVSSVVEEVTIDASGTRVVALDFRMPSREGDYVLTAELQSPAETHARTRKIAYVFSEATLNDVAGIAGRCGLLSDASGFRDFFTRYGIRTSDPARWEGCRCLIAEGPALRDSGYASLTTRLSGWVRDGGTLLIVEPEQGTTVAEVIPILDDVSLRIEPRNEMDKGGYDSYIFADDHAHPLWNGIGKRHLQMFNGGFGGEIVSAHTVTPVWNGSAFAVSVLARCGLKLAIPAVFEIRYGRGKILVSRLQMRGRLSRTTGGESLYDRRPDPVLMRFLLNCILYSDRPESAGTDYSTEAMKQ